MTAKHVQVQLGEYRGVFAFHCHGVECRRNDYVILEINKAAEFGRVVSDPGKETGHKKTEKIKGKVVRKVTEGDLKQIENNRMKARDAFNTCLRKVSERKLAMRMLKAEYTFDCGKVIFFFTADGRVDFRQLVKELARIFRVRIELKQIGVRDKAKIVGGYGVCGRELCCSSYMHGFHALSIKMAKEQHLPLNPSRISGVCGRIKCCMAYEFEVYKRYAHNLPRVGEKYLTAEGKGRVVDVNILKRTLTVELEEGRQVKVVMTRPGEN